MAVISADCGLSRRRHGVCSERFDRNQLWRPRADEGERSMRCTLLATVVALPLFAGGCVIGDDLESFHDDVWEDDADPDADPEELTTLEQGAIWCPAGTSYDATYRLCASATEAIGPFTSIMIERCRDAGGGDACANTRWSAALARSTRGTGACPPGAVMDNYLGFCVEGQSVFGPFSASMVAACKDGGGGSACETMRWARASLGPTDRRWLSAPYFYQYHNAHEPGGTCGLTSASMMLRFWGETVTPDGLYRAYGKARGQSPEGLASLYQAHGLHARYSRAGSFAMIKRQIDAGRPVVVHGWFTSAGHILVVVGYNAQGFIVNDPAGLWSGCVACGYAGRTPTNGRGALYGYAAFRAAVGFDGDIWLSSASDRAFSL
jgi:uncharacterized protein YvpB